MMPVGSLLITYHLYRYLYDRITSRKKGQVGGEMPGLSNLNPSHGCHHAVTTCNCDVRISPDNQIAQ